MIDPQRLTDSDASDFERMLLGVAAREQPTPWQRRRMRRAVTLTKLGILGTALNALASFIPHGLGAALVTTSFIAGASSPIQATRPTRAPSVTHRGIPATPLRVNEPESDTRLSADTGLASDPASARPNEVATAKSSAASKSRVAVAGHHGADLRDEIALLDEARLALRQGQAARTLSAIDRYRSSFQSRAFDQEATVLRIEALDALGNRSRAAQEAKSFLSRHPNSPHGDRLKRLLDKSAANAAD
jgi:hypothetical protein